MSLLKRPPGDLFTFRLFMELASKVKVPKDTLYIWSAVLDPTYKFGWWPSEGVFEIETELEYRTRLTNNITSDLILLGVKDHLTAGDFNFYTDKMPTIADYLGGLFRFYENKTFIFFTSVENVESYIQQENVKIIPWGGDITNHQNEYKSLDPVMDKNFNSNTTFLSLNRNKRSHRAMLVSLLYGLNIETHGLISCMFANTLSDGLFEYTKWNTDNKAIYLKGFKKLQDVGTTINDNPEIYENNNNNNVHNFKNSLSNYYRDTFVEIISETSYTESCFNLTEKTLNSVYGACFPILLCSKGSVEFLRTMGLDVFDDIVDHSYDNISDPAIRLETAIKNNIELLTNNTKTKQLWIQNKERFQKNIDFCRERMYNFYYERAKEKFMELINDLNLQR